MEDPLNERLKKLALKLDLDSHRVPHTIEAGGGPQFIRVFLGLYDATNQPRGSDYR